MKKWVLLGCMAPVLFIGFLVVGSLMILVSMTGASIAAGSGDEHGQAPTGNGALMWPLRSHIVTSDFGLRHNPTSGAGTETHWGIDFAGAMGEPVRAAHAGRVNLAGWSGGYGNLIVLVRGDGLVTYYGHLSEFAVDRGNEVAAGDVIGYVGSTGRSTGPHLHFEVRPTGGSPVDPTPYLGSPDQGEPSLFPSYWEGL